MYQFVFAIIIAFLLVKLIQRLLLNRRLPPGPSGVPFLGVAPWIKPATAHLTLMKWSKTHGGIMSLWMGPKLFIILADLKIMKDALLKQADIFTGRPRTPGGNLTHKNHGLLQSDGPLWKEQRRFALSTLRDFGFGKPILENRIVEENEYLAEEIKKLDGKPTDLQWLLNSSVSNIICALIFGCRFEYGDERFRGLMEHFSFVATRNGQNIFGQSSFLPFRLMRMIDFKGRGKKALGRIRQIEEFCGEMIDEHKKSYSKESEPEDYIHAFMAASERENGGKYFTDFQLLQSVISLFIAGTETTSTTLRWAILLLAQHPEIQDQVRAVISELVGHGNAPRMTDRSKLPLTEATIYEVQRIANLVPLSLPHRTEVDTELEGYFIPKDAIVIPLLWAAHFDPKLYKDPEKFDPQRFLEGGKTIKTDALVPFSIGKRSCLGESLAKMELFLYFTTLVQKFRFELPEGQEMSRDWVNDRLVGITSSPLNFDVCSIPI